MQIRAAGRLLLLPVLLSGALQGTAGAQESADRGVLAAEMRASLGDLLDAWYPRTADYDQGGFLSRFDHAWRPEGPQEKMIVTQARHVWTTARLSLFFPNDDDPYLPLAAHGFVFLRDVLWDAEHGGFHWLVSREGTPLPDGNKRFIKQAYGNAFGIYALAAYYEASGDAEALELAREAFRWLDNHAHDPVHGGYFQFLERDGTPLREGYGDTPKDQNSSIHLLEAFTELYRVWPDPVLESRLADLLSLIRDTQTAAPGHLTPFSHADWTPVSYRDSTEATREAHHHLDHVSFGHDVETAYLMLEAADALGLDPDTTLEAGKRMVDHALRNGWDESVGGFYDAGYYLPDRPGVTIVRDTKNWWAQAEGLNTLLLMADLYPADPLRYEEKFLELWEYVRTYLIDHEHGGWYEGGVDRDPENRIRPKAHIWKAAYHDGRALMNVVRRLEGAESSPP